MNEDPVTRCLVSIFPEEMEDYRNLHADFRSILADWYHRDAFHMGEMWLALIKSQLHIMHTSRKLAQDILMRIPEPEWVSFLEAHMELGILIYREAAYIDGCLVKVMSHLISDNRLAALEILLRALDENSGFGYPLSFYNELFHYPFVSFTAEAQRMLIKRGGSRIQAVMQDAVYRSCLLSQHYSGDRITAMIRLGMKYRENSGAQFAAQTRAMEGYEPFPVSEVPWYPYTMGVPSYNHMNRSQLEWYFYWRSEWKKGRKLHCSVEYIYVYAFTLMNGIDVQEETEAYRKLQELFAALPEPDSRLMEWIHDYAVYYEIPSIDLQRFLAKYDADVTFRLERIAAMLQNPEGQEMLPTALACAGMKSKPWMEKKYYKEFSQFFNKAMLCVKREYEARLRKSFTDVWTGRPYPKVWEPLAGVPIELKPAREGDERRVNAYESYRYIKGRWMGWHYYGADRKWLSQLIRTVDSVYRTQMKLAGRHQRSEIEPWIRECIEKAAGRYLRRSFTVDFGALNGIRRESEALQERLILEEDDEKESFTKPPLENTIRHEAMQKRRFTPEEEEVLKLLLHGQREQVIQYARKKGTLPQVFYESINEKALDWIGDILIEDGVLYREYQEQLEEYLIQ